MLPTITYQVRRTWVLFLRRIQREPSSEDVVILGLAVLTGILGALAAALFYKLLALAYSGIFAWPVKRLAWGGEWFYRPLLTGAGVALAAWIVRRLGDSYDGLNIPDVYTAVTSRSGQLPARPAAAKTVASAVTISGGGSAGAEAPIAVLGAVLGSQLAQRLRLRVARTRVLVGAGAAAGIAAAFNAPLAGAFFALEEILKSFSTVAFAPVVISSVTAAVFSSAILGPHPAFPTPVAAGYTFYREILVFFPVLGIAAGLVAGFFVRLEDTLARHRWRRQVHPQLRPWLGGIIVGLIVTASGGLLASRGSTEIHLDSIIMLPWYLALVLAVGKVIATAVTLNTGGSGGVFAPSLFTGALVGSAVAGLFGIGFPNLPIETSAYVVVGMGAMLAAATGAPITGILFVFEVTRDYGLLLPLMLAVVFAVVVRRLIIGDTLYTSWLRRSGRGSPAEAEIATTATRPIPPPAR
ncbi:MAG: chloride channel protein [Gemmatimonadales bacterium]